MLIASFDVGTVNMSLCIISYHDEIIHHWSVFSIKSTSAEGNCKLLFKYLDNIEILNGVSKIVIEKQPRVNTKARVVEGYLVSYFVLRNTDRKLNRTIIKYSPKHKLKIYEGTVPSFNVKSAYSIRKKTAVYITSDMIKNQSTDIKEIFISNKRKQDDLADSYCQCIAYIRFVLNKKRPITTVPVNIIDDVGASSDDEVLEEFI